MFPDKTPAISAVPLTHPHHTADLHRFYFLPVSKLFQCCSGLSFPQSHNFQKAFHPGWFCLRMSFQGRYWRCLWSFLYLQFPIQYRLPIFRSRTCLLHNYSKLQHYFLRLPDRLHNWCSQRPYLQLHNCYWSQLLHLCTRSVHLQSHCPLFR